MNKIFVYIIIVLSSLIGLEFAIYILDDICFKEKFDSLTSTLFSGFLTVSAFIFAFETFIIFKMREDIYDSAFYKETFAKKLSNEERYIPLKNFSDLLLKSTAISFFTAILYIVYIIWTNAFTFIITITFSFLTIAYLSMSWILLKKNLSYYFSFLERKS